MQDAALDLLETIGSTVIAECKLTN